MGEYYFPLEDGDSDDAILQWLKSVCNIVTTIAPEENHQPQALGKGQPPTKKKPELAPTFEEDWEDAMFSSPTLIKSYVAKDVCKEMNLGTEEVPKIIKVYELKIIKRFSYRMEILV